jgi:hypothetical protein
VRSPIPPAAGGANAHHGPAPAVPGTPETAHNERVICLSLFFGDEFAKELIVTGQRHAKAPLDNVCLAEPFEPPATFKIQDRSVTFAECHSAHPAT